MDRHKNSAEGASVSRKTNEAGCVTEDDRVLEEANLSAPVSSEYGEVSKKCSHFAST